MLRSSSIDWVGITAMCTLGLTLEISGANPRSWYARAGKYDAQEATTERKNA